MLRRIAHFAYRRRRIVLVGWVALLVGLFAVASAAGGSYHTDFRLSGSESIEAFDLLERSGFADRAGAQGQIVFETRDGVEDPAVRAAMEGLFAEVDEQIPRLSIDSPYDPEHGDQIAGNGEIAYAQVNVAERADQSNYQEIGKRIEEMAQGVDVPGLSVTLGGDMFWDPEIGGTAEAVGVLAAAVILLFAFGSVLAMGLPLLTAFFGIACGAALVLLARNIIDMPDFTLSAVAMVAIGVGIDYALLIVTRYREFLGRGLDPERSVAYSIDTAGRASLFAGCTVIISVLGLLFMGLDALKGVAIAISIGVLMTMLASITLLPAALGFVGTNINRFGLPHRRRSEASGRESFWYRWSRMLQRRPWPAAIAGTVVLLLLASPVLFMRLGFSDASSRPPTDTTRQAYDTLSEGFGPGFSGSLLLAAETPNGASDAEALAALQREVDESRGVELVTPPLVNDEQSVAILQVFPTSGPQTEATAQLVDRLRDDVIPAATAGTDLAVKVGGITAAVDDWAAYSASRLPVFILIVLVLSFLLLMVVFRSVLVPLKAVVMNLLSIGAAYGIVVIVFQWGWGLDLIGEGVEGPVDAWAPIFLFAIVFGLSMDYEVFLLSRIREEYDRTGDNATAVADGLALTARVITAAAAIMVCVFGSFMFGADRGIQLFGLGLAAAVLVDATLVRLVLVPATMELLGDRNWWLPKWLDRILPRLHVEASPELDEELDQLVKSEGATKV